MPPDERRRAIVEAATPVLISRGRDITTRDIAAAAGVAEGTIFKAFESKDAVIEAIVEHLLDVGDTCAEIDRLRPTDLEDACGQVLTLLQRRIREVTAVFMVLHTAQPERARDHSAQHEQHAARNELLMEAMSRLLDPWQHQLRLPARTAASLLRSCAFATSHPLISDGALTDPTELTTVLLHGLAMPQVPDRVTTTGVGDPHHQEASC